MTDPTGDIQEIRNKIATLEFLLSVTPDGVFRLSLQDQLTAQQTRLRQMEIRIMRGH